jgi:hypothetical protein
MNHDLARVLEALVVALPAIIAAISSLLNGKEARRVRKELAETKQTLVSGLGVNKTEEKL